MAVLNIGSLNLDYVYRVDHFVRPGETLAASHRAVHAGGKGLNQSVALARAGATVLHAGCVGADGGSSRAKASTSRCLPCTSPRRAAIPSSR